MTLHDITVYMRTKQARKTMEKRMINKEELVELKKQAELLRRIKRINRVAKKVRSKYPAKLNVRDTALESILRGTL